MDLTMVQQQRLLKTYDWGKYIRLDQDVLKTSAEDEDERRLQDIFKTSASRPMFAGYVKIIPRNNFIVDHALLEAITSVGNKFSK